jgi:hypothetical protein
LARRLAAGFLAAALRLAGALRFAVARFADRFAAGRLARRLAVDFRLAGLFLFAVDFRLAGLFLFAVDLRFAELLRFAGRFAALRLAVARFAVLAAAGRLVVRLRTVRLRFMADIHVTSVNVGWLRSLTFAAM